MHNTLFVITAYRLATLLVSWIKQLIYSEYRHVEVRVTGYLPKVKLKPLQLIESWYKHGTSFTVAMKNSAEIRAYISYNAVLVAILIVYWLLGACVFRKLEAVNSASITNDHQMEDSKEKLLKELWDQNSLEFDQWSTQARKKLDSYEKNFMVELSNSTAEWSLTDSWLFALTIFTSIGKRDF